VPPTISTHWVTLRLVVDEDQVELATAALWDAGVAGIEERTVRDGQGAARVELLAGAPADLADQVSAAVEQRWTIEVAPVEGDEWLDEWRRWARPWRAGGRLVVVPQWLDLPEWLGRDDLVVRLDPGRAFGSGAHATTRLCLAELEHRVSPGDRVLDVGAGSGVLAVAAAHLGAADVEAVDIDEEAVRATAANAVLNAVDGVVRASCTPVERAEGGRDLVVANIGADTLVALAPHLVRALRPGGVLVLSGVLACQAEAVGTAVVAAGATIAGTAADGDWRALVFEVPA
jgi:ribosomal protein L11 methyltransferase